MLSHLFLHFLERIVAWCDWHRDLLFRRLGCRAAEFAATLNTFAKLAHLVKCFHRNCSDVDPSDAAHAEAPCPAARVESQPLSLETSLSFPEDINRAKLSLVAKAKAGMQIAKSEIQISEIERAAIHAARGIHEMRCFYGALGLTNARQTPIMDPVVTPAIATMMKWLLAA